MKSRTSMTRRVATQFALLALFAGTISVAIPAVTAAAATYEGLSFRLQGCKGDAGQLPNGSGKFICPDAEYTDGNLGKGWNELDLVPHRVIIDAGTSAPASQTYKFDIAADNLNGTKVGYDFIENGVEAVSAACQNVSVGPQQTLATGATTQAIYREITVTQAKNTTCQIDLYIRLGLGAHLYPGSSLHSNLLNDVETTAGIGNKENSIPVNAILPQSLSKDMSASQGSDVVWNIVKESNPAVVDFGDTCATGAPTSKSLSVKVTWTKLAASPSGDITIITHVYATNPAHRTITVNVTDNVYKGTGQLAADLVHTATSGPVDVPANTTQLILTENFTTPAGPTTFNDVATATYTDKITGFPVPGSTTATATATVQSSGNVSNDTAVITDVESITGAGLTYSADSFSGASGSFDNGYVAGTATSGSVGWTSASQSASGSVTFAKTVYFTGPGSTSGTISDTATVTGAGGFTASANASSAISASASATITVQKSIPVVLGAGDADQTFTFHVNPGNVTKTITFGQGDGGAGNYKSVDFTGLTFAGNYTVSEDTLAPFTAQSAQSVTNAGCSNTVTFNNTLGATSADVRKITDPPSYEAGWVFDLYRDNAPAGPDVGDTLLASKTTTGTSAIAFGVTLGEGNYYVLEHNQTGWTSDGGTGCVFTVNLPADAGKVFHCVFKNTSRGHAAVIKKVNGGTTSDVFTFELRSGVNINNPADPSDDTPGSLLDTKQVTANGNPVSFTPDLIPGQTYTVCEFVMPGWSTDLGGASQYTLVIADNNVRVCTDFVAGFGTTTTFTVNNNPPPGGNQLTIGFWKNWASCKTSNGKQAPVLDQTLFKAGGITIGTLFLRPGTGNLSPDCSKAVNILNKSTATGGKKMASDPLFNMAAQLLAADLNVAAGAGTCPAATTAINSAQALLVKYSWNGDTYTPKLTAADATLANSLASTLDQYNNGLLC
jgi:hypothetical protein